MTYLSYFIVFTKIKNRKAKLMKYPLTKELLLRFIVNCCNLKDYKIASNSFYLKQLYESDYHFK